MKIVIHENPAMAETEIVINCPAADETILRMIAGLQAYDQKLTGLKDGRTFLLEAADVLYFDTADKRTFLYTRNDVYETSLRLYEAEERLAGFNFFRVSKSMVVNLKKIKSLKPDFGGRLEITLENNERCNVSRQYASVIKKQLGL